MADQSEWIAPCSLLPVTLALLLPLVLAIVACGGGEPSGDPPPLSGPIREMLEEVAAARGLEAPTNLRMEVVAPEDMVEVYTGPCQPMRDRETLQEGGALYQLLGYIEPGDETYWDVTLSTCGVWHRRVLLVRGTRRSGS